MTDVANMLEHFHDAAGEAVQPYFAAYMIEHGYRVASEPFKTNGHNNEYMEWNSARWNEFFGSIGISMPEFKNCYAEQFTDWLAARALDHLAMAAIEGRLGSFAA